MTLVTIGASHFDQQPDGNLVLVSQDAVALNWLDAEIKIRAQIETQWALSAFAAMPLTWENEDIDWGDRYMAVNIEGYYAEKTIYGSVGKRSSIEGGMVYFHAFIPTGSGKRQALAAVLTMSGILELQTIGGRINLAGANPPSPVEIISTRDRELPGMAQPGGNFYRCSGSVPFILIGTR